MTGVPLGAPVSWGEATTMVVTKWSPEETRDLYNAVANAIWFPTGTDSFQRAETPDLLIRSLLGDAAMGGWSANLQDHGIEEAPPGLWEALFTTDMLELPRIAGDTVGRCAGVRAVARYRLTVEGAPRPEVS